MRHALLLAQRFDKRDGRQLRVRAALREAGFSVDSLAFDSGGDANRDPETRDLRPRAAGLLMLASQLVMAGIIAGYFMAFYPVVMTTLFWLLVGSAVFLTSPFGRNVRNSLLHRLAEFLSRFETAKHGYELIWASDPETLRVAVRLANRHNARLVYDAHEFHREESPDDDARRQWVIREEEAASARIDQLVTINDPIAGLYREALPARAASVIRNAVDPQTLDKANSPLRAAAGVSADHRILLYHGSLRSLRYLEELVKAADLLPDNWILVIMGEGELKADLAAINSRAVILDAVPYSDLPEWVAGADLGAVLYEDRGLNQHYCSPNKLYELIAYGVPILATDLPELGRYAGDQGCGKVMAGEVTPQAIADAVAALDEDALARMREACQKTAASLSWEREKARLIDLVNAPR